MCYTHKKFKTIIKSSISCLVCQHKDINETEKQLNADFCNIYDWLVDNKLSIHFAEEKTKSILFNSKFKKKIIKKLNIKYRDIQIKQHSKVQYLGCLMEVKAMALNVIHKIYKKLKLLYCKNVFLTPN